MKKNFLKKSIQNEFSWQCIALIIILIIFFSISFFIVTKEEDKVREYTLGGPDNFLGLDDGENCVMIIDEESTAQKKEYYHLVYRWRVQLGKEYQTIFPIYKHNPYFPVVITENIENSQLIQDEHYLVHEEPLLGTILRWVEIIEYPQFLKETEEFVLTIQCYVDHKEVGAIYRNVWTIAIHNIEYPNRKKIVDRVSIILPKDAYIWKSDKTVWITPFIKKEEDINIDIDIEDRIGLSWYLIEEPVQTIKLGFGTPVERLHWENRENEYWAFVWIIVGLFLATTVTIMFSDFDNKKHKNCILLAALTFCIFCLLLIRSKASESPIPTDIGWNMIYTGITFGIIYVTLWYLSGKRMANDK